MPSTTNAYPWYSPRFWHGMRAGHYFRLLAENRFRISPRRWGLAAAISGFSLFNSAAWQIQRLRYGRTIDQLEFEQPPVFIIGHWRSGTTLLHEYLVRDQRLAFPTTYQCFAPTHFLLTDWILPKLFGWILPSRRPMDDMATGFDRPQEDEFALCALGAPTPYRRMAFPMGEAPFLEFLDMRECDPKKRELFERTLVWFVKAVTYRSHGKRLILKSPPHTGRVATLARLFPGARFVHITRHPFEIFPSTCRLWRSLDHAQALKMPCYSDEWLQEYVLECFERMYRGFDEQSQGLATNSLFEVRYEDLVKEPVETLRRMYEKLELGDFAPTEAAMTTFASSQREYRPNRHQLDPALAEKISERWRSYFERYGYDSSPTQ